MQERTIRPLLLIILFLLSIAYGQSGEFSEYLQVLQEKFMIPQIKIDSLNFNDVILLDTRELEEYEVSHIQSAIYVGYQDFSLETVDTLQRDAEIVVYCSVGQDAVSDEYDSVIIETVVFFELIHNIIGKCSDDRSGGVCTCPLFGTGEFCSLEI